MVTKSKVVVPPIINVGGSDEEPKATTVIKKTADKPAENLTQVLAKTEDYEDRMSKVA